MSDIIDFEQMKNNKDVHPLLRVKDEYGVWWYRFSFEYKHATDKGKGTNEFTFFATSAKDAKERLESILNTLCAYKPDESIYPLMLCSEEYWV